VVRNCWGIIHRPCDLLALHLTDFFTVHFVLLELSGNIYPSFAFSLACSFAGATKILALAFLAWMKALEIIFQIRLFTDCIWLIVNTWRQDQRSLLDSGLGPENCC
jgi:hypothetical protein